MCTLEPLGLVWSTPEACKFQGRDATKKTAQTNSAFWSLYKTQKTALNAQGYRVYKDGNGQWTVAHFEVSPDVLASCNTAIEASRATDTTTELKVLPNNLQYFPFQKAGIAFGMARDSVLIADEPGLGKTIQAIGIINETNAKKILVICPATLRINWRNEMSKWLINKLSIGVIEAGSDFPDTDIVIINYNLLSRFAQELRAHLWDVLIADEAHYLKNPKALRTQQVIGRTATKKLPATMPIPAVKKIFLTGTPIVNRPVEVWTLANFLAPSKFSNFFGFAKRYCNAYKDRFGWHFDGASNLDELQTRLRETIMVRRLKADVLKDLPAKIRQVVVIPPNGAENIVKIESETIRSHEDRVTAAQVAIELAKASDSESAYVNAINALQEAKNLAFTEMAKARHATALAKIPYVLEHIESIETGKLVIFAHHKDVIKALKDALKEHGVVTLTGDQTAKEKQEAIEAFQNNPNIRFFIGSIQAAGVGITLTAASHVIFAELDWTPGNMTQAEDRCHRIGQTNSVLVQHIVIDGSFDANLAQTIVNKQDVIDQSLDNKVITESATIDLSKAVAATVTLTKAQIATEAKDISEDIRKAIHDGLKALALCDEDHAEFLNNQGYNRIDGQIGHALANCAYLTYKQAVLGKKILKKYARQLGSLYAKVFA